jgi:hypothetical protein
MLVTSLDESLKRIPAGTHIWIRSDINLTGIEWEDRSIGSGTKVSTLLRVHHHHGEQLHVTDGH